LFYFIAAVRMSEIKEYILNAAKSGRLLQGDCGTHENISLYGYFIAGLFPLQ